MRSADSDKKRASDDAMNEKMSKPPGPGKGGNVGDALRAVYREAVAERIPDEMLDLLNKLG